MQTAITKRPLSGGKLTLKVFQVRGYTRQIVEHKTYFLKAGLPVEVLVKRNEYVPASRVENLKALSAYEAAKAYARSKGWPIETWEKHGGERIIRVSNANEVAP